MSTPHKAKPFEVENPAAAFANLERFTRKILAVPKKSLDKRIPADKNKRRKAN
jgi:hypothetical protein